MFFRFFDRTPVSRDRYCYSLTKISEILGGRQRFGIRQRFYHFEHGGPVYCGSKSGHKSRVESTCTRINTSARRRTRPSAGPERSQLLQILPSRVSDPHWFNADPDTDPDPAFLLIADPDSGSGSRIRIQDPDPGFDELKLKKITAEKKINFFLDHKLKFTYL